MSDIRKVMNEEIRRLARKEIKAVVAPLLAAGAVQKKRIAELEKRIKVLEAKPSQKAGQPAIVVPEAQEGGKEKQIRLTAARIRKVRTKLSISQEQFAKILGVNTQSVNFWENGKTSPRLILKKQIAAIRDMGKREIAKILTEKGIVVKKAKKAIRKALQKTVTGKQKTVKRLKAVKPAAADKKSQAPAAKSKKTQAPAAPAAKAPAQK